MKMIIAIIGLAFLAGCAHSPELIRVKNCKDIGAGLFDCEKIRDRDFDSRK